MCQEMTTKLEEQSAQVGLNISREKTKVMGITQRPLTQPIAIAQGNIAAVFRRLDNVWRSSTLSLKIKLDLYTSLIISTAIYASETWKSTARIRQQLDAFHHRNLRKILGITWKDHVTNMEVLSRTGQRRDTGHCSREATSGGRSHHQDASCHLDDQPIMPCHGPLVV